MPPLLTDCLRVIWRNLIGVCPEKLLSRPHIFIKLDAEAFTVAAVSIAKVRSTRPKDVHDLTTGPRLDTEAEIVFDYVNKVALDQAIAKDDIL